jgi:hypothetical protein
MLNSGFHSTALGISEDNQPFDGLHKCRSTSALLVAKDFL